MCAKTIKSKGLQDLLGESKSLTEKMTYAEFQSRNAQQYLDDGIDNAYKTYRDIINTLNA